MELNTKGRYSVTAMADLAKYGAGDAVPLSAIAERRFGGSLAAQLRRVVREDGLSTLALLALAPPVIAAGHVSAGLVPFMLVFALGSALTALSGLVAAPMLTIYPAMGHNIIIDAFVVLVLGGLGSLRGTIVASLLVGQVQTLGAVVMPEFALVVVFAMMGLVLLVRPRGLLNLGRLDDGH